MSFDSTNSWIILPVIQTIMTVSAGIILYIYGRQVSKQMGGGILGNAMSFIIVMSFLIAAFTILSLFGYLWLNVTLLALGNFMIMAVAAGEVILAYYTKKFAEELKSMASDD